MFSATEKLFAAVDYLTLTLPYAAPWDEHMPWDAAGRAALKIAVSSDAEKPARILGYAGTRRGSVFFGHRPDGSLLQVSGRSADIIAGWDFTPSVRCTRIDVCVDITYQHYEPGVAKYAARQALDARTDGRLRSDAKVVLYLGFGRGDTCYLGSRQSERMVRIYDKEKESGETAFERTWRVELECKQSAAQQTWTAVAPEATRATAITSVLATQLDKWCVTVDCLRDVDRVVHRASHVDGGNDVRRLAWLANSVRPTVERLACVYGRDVLLSTLGLDGDAQKGA